MSDQPTEQDLEADVIVARIVIGSSSLIMLMVILVVSIYFKVHKSPGFVWQ